ncbi:hypothetical protein AVEN_27547-1 [Araneus ventricosus]|uniref:Uncharacterized protein n=1 Tax=Araneus ventricosus TaxID=182803 RepID=A0A4Y2UB66_ARAVE|nr:hypothetical protein AVEN_27547-1 [Araneus ventricosus]
MALKTMDQIKKENDTRQHSPNFRATPAGETFGQTGGANNTTMGSSIRMRSSKTFLCKAAATEADIRNGSSYPTNGNEYR